MGKWRCTTSADDVTTRADTAKQAADIIARRLYGRRGVCASFRLDCWAEDGSSQTWEAFLGKRVRDGVSGRNVWVYLRRVEA